MAIIERFGRFIKEKDAFGLFDLLAVKGRSMALIQVTSNNPHVHRNFQEWAKEHASDNVKVLQVVFKDRAGHKVYEYHQDGKKTVELFS